MTQVLLVGLPRSATTWVGRCIGHAAGARYIDEPDNENIHPYAVRAKRRLGRYPILRPQDQAPPDYERLWALAAAGGEQPAGLRGRVSHRFYDPVRWHAHPEGRRDLGTRGHLRLRASELLATAGRATPFEHLVVKSVFVPFAMEWLVRRWDGPIVLAVRDPLNAVASWWDLGWRDVLGHHRAFGTGASAVPEALIETLGEVRVPPLVEPHSPLQLLAWQFGLLSSALLSSYRRHPEWVLARHDELCSDPVPKFKALFARVGLPWSDTAEEFLLESDRPGSGAFDTTRVASREHARWRDRLSPEQVSEVRQVIEGFELSW